MREWANVCENRCQPVKAENCVYMRAPPPPRYIRRWLNLRGPRRRRGKQTRTAARGWLRLGLGPTTIRVCISTCTYAPAAPTTITFSYNSRGTLRAFCTAQYRLRVPRRPLLIMQNKIQSDLLVPTPVLAENIIYWRAHGSPLWKIIMYPRTCIIVITVWGV